MFLGPSKMEKRLMISFFVLNFKIVMPVENLARRTRINSLALILKLLRIVVTSVFLGYLEKSIIICRKPSYFQLLPTCARRQVLPWHHFFEKIKNNLMAKMASKIKI
jgi:hypothetical protein